MPPQKFTQDELIVRLHVQLGFVLTLGLYDGPITKETIAEHIKQMLADTDVEEFIESIQIVNLELENGTVLAAHEAS
jgi:hypothetical protein